MNPLQKGGCFDVNFEMELNWRGSVISGSQLMVGRVEVVFQCPCLSKTGEGKGKER